MVKKLSDALLQQLEEDAFNEAELDLSGQYLTIEQIKALVKALKHNQTVTSLNLDNTGANDLACVSLAELTTIDTLDIPYNAITAEGARALSRGSFKHLNLSANPIGNQGALWFEDSPLISLDLSGCDLMGEEIAPLFKNTSLKRLMLGCQGLTDGVLQFLPDNLILEELDLEYNKLTEEGMIYIEANQSLKTLILSFSHILDKGAERCSRNTSIEVLTVSQTHLSDQGAKALALNPRLKKLDISGNHLTSEGAIALLKHPTLESIDFSYNRITREALLFYQSLDDTHLKDVNFFENFMDRSYSGPS